MADTYEKDLGQKSSLTTSDFIRVVGSDNVSYKQLVSDVANTIIGQIGKNANYTGDLNDLKTQGYWYCGSSATNIPTGFTAVHLLVERVSVRAVQIAIQFGGTMVAVRTSANSGNTWGNWQYQPTRAEIDSLNSKIGNVYSNITGISNGASVSIDLPSGAMGIMFTTGVGASGRGIYAWGTSSSGGVSGSWLVQATGISVDMSTNNIIKFTNTSGAYVSVISFR